MSWLKDRWEELNAQVKMGDNKTASTVRAARKPAAPAQTMRANTNQPGWSVRKPQPAPLTTQQRISQSYGPTGFTGLKNYAKDMLFDNNSEADRIKRYAATGLNESYDQEQARKTKEAQASNDKLGTIHQVMKSLPAGTADFLAKTPGAIGQMQGRTAKMVNEIDNPLLRTGAKLVSAPLGGLMTTKQADTNIKTGRGLNERIDNKMQQSAFGDRADDNKYVTGAGKMFGQLGGQIATGGLGTVAIGSQMAADEANKAEAAGKSNTYSTLTGFGQGGIGALSEKYGVDKFIPGKGNVAGNFVTRMGKRIFTEGAQEGQQQFTQNYIANKAYNPNQSLKEGVLESALMGGLAGGAMSPAVDIMNRPTAPKPTTSLVAPKPEPTRTRLRPEEARIWSDYQETLYKGNRMPAQVVNETHNKARQIADSLGVDIITGSPDEIAGRMNPLLEQSMAFQKEPTTSLVSRARSVVKPLNSVGGGILPTPLDNMADKLNNKSNSVDPLESLKAEARKYKSAEEFVKAYESKTRSEYTDRFNKSLELLPEKPRVVKKGITKRSAEVGNTISKRADAQVVENVDAGLAVMREASNKDQSLTGRWMDAVKTKNVPDQYKRYDVIDGKVKTSFVDMSPEESRTFYEKNRPLFQDGTLLYENDRIYSNTPKINKEQLTSLYNENNGIIDGNVYDNNTSRTQGVGQKTGSLQKKAGAKQTSQNTRPVQSTRLLAPQPPKTKGVAPQPTKTDPLELNNPVNKRMSDVDSSERGNLNQYKATKKVQYEQLKELKRQYKEGNIITKGNLRVPLMMARSKYQETLAAIKNAEKIIDSRAKELGQTTKLSKSDPLESLKQEAKKVTNERIVKNFEDELAGFKTQADWERSLDSEDIGMMRPEFKAYADAYYAKSQPPKSTPTVAKPVQKQVTEKQNSVDPLESLKQEARKYNSAEEFAMAKLGEKYGFRDRGDLNNRLNTEQAKYSDLRNRLKRTKNQEAKDKLQKEIDDLVEFQKRDLPRDEMGNTKSFTRQELELIDLYNQATQPPKSPTPLESLKQEAKQPEPRFERDIDTGKMKMQSSKPATKEKYSVANSDIVRTKSPGMNQDGFTVEDWGGKKRYVSLEGASPETQSKVRRAEAEYETARANSTGPVAPGTRGAVQIAKEKVDDAYSDAINDLKLGEYATTASGGRTFNSRYNEWLEAKYKDTSVDSTTIKDMNNNPQKYRSQFEAETATQSQPPKSPPVQKVETPVESETNVDTEPDYKPEYYSDKEMQQMAIDHQKWVETEDILQKNFEKSDAELSKLTGMTKKEVAEYKDEVATATESSKEMNDMFERNAQEEDLAARKKIPGIVRRISDFSKADTAKMSDRAFKKHAQEAQSLENELRQVMDDLDTTGIQVKYDGETYDTKGEVKIGKNTYIFLDGDGDADREFINTTKLETVTQTNQATPKPPTPFEQNLQQAGLAPKKSKGLVVSETKPLNGQKIQKVRTAPGKVEQRVVQDQSDRIADALGVPQDQREPSFNAVAAAKNSSSAKRLVEALNMNDDITQAAAQAQQDGKEINFFAKKDASGRSVGVERFNPKYHKIDAGFVTDQDGNVLGNHIKVDATGVQVNVGGDLVNMESVLGNPNSWRNKYETSSTMERNIYKNAPDKATADKTYKFTVAHKIQSEANFKTELSQQRQALKDRTKATMAAKPRRTSDTEYKSDMFDFIENNATYTDMIGKYGEQTAKVMSDYKTSTRTMYNDLLKRVNEKFQQFGIDPVPQRKDYLTHINELMGNNSYIGELAGQLQNSITGEGSERTRGAVPGEIAGRTENFKPTKKWNKFFQERKGGEFTKDPFKAVDAYLEPTLHNIHMTESGVRTRAVEAAFRTAAQLKSMDTSHVTKELDDSIAKFKVQGNNDKLIRGFQEYANAITGKTQAWDRQVIDSSDAAATGLRGWQKLQSVAGRATILGNANSVLMQPLNQVATLSQVGPRNYLKGLAATISGDKSIEKSPFITARQAKVDSNFKTKGQRVMDAGGVPLEMVEMASVKATWNAQHQSVLKDGYKGQEAIIETDRRTERTVAGRGIADKPELYRSTLANGVLQYTLEVNAQNKMFWRDLSPGQKATFMVATLGVNSVLGAVTGNTPLPDFLKAAFESIQDFADGEDEDSALKDAGQTLQRFAGEGASMNPLASGVANLLPKSTRQTVFGKESDLGRYDGTAAPIQVVKNVVDAGSKLTQGKFKDARNSALKTVPFGNQIQKTWRGAEAISEGKTEGSPWQAAKAIAFGPNAINTDTAKETKFSATPSSSKGTVNASSVDGKTTFAPTADEILKNQFSTKEQKAWLKLSAADRKAEAEQDPEKAKWLKQYEATKRVNKNAPERPEGLSKESETILNWHNKRTPQQREKLAYTQNDYDYKLATAQFEEAKLNGTVSRAEMINKQQALTKAKVGKDFTKDTRESYNSLSKAELTTLAENDPNGRQIMADAIAYGDALVKAGLIKKNKLRTGSGSGGKRGGRGGKGKASKFDYTKNLFDSGSDSASTSKQLRAILEKAMSGKS